MSEASDLPIDPLVCQVQALLAEVCHLRIENERLKHQAAQLSQRLRAVNTARSLLRQRLRKIL